MMIGSVSWACIVVPVPVALPLIQYPEGPSTQYLGTWVLGNGN